MTFLNILAIIRKQRDIKCLNCEKIGKISICYYGETSRNLYLRSKENYGDLYRGRKFSWMAKHIDNDCTGSAQSVELEWKVEGKFTRPLHRQLKETDRIKRSKLHT